MKKFIFVHITEDDEFMYATDKEGRSWQKPKTKSGDWEIIEIQNEVKKEPISGNT